MRITEKQLMILFDLAIWFSQLNMSWRGMGPPFDKEVIIKLVNEIFDQQSDEIFDIK